MFHTRTLSLTWLVPSWKPAGLKGWILFFLARNDSRTALTRFEKGSCQSITTVVSLLQVWMTDRLIRLTEQEGYVRDAGIVLSETRALPRLKCTDKNSGSKGNRARISQMSKNKSLSWAFSDLSTEYQAERSPSCFYTCFHSSTHHLSIKSNQ